VTKERVMSQKDEPQRPLPYERTGSASGLITRGQFRWLLALLTVHLLIVIQTTYAPGLRIAVKEWRADRQQKAAREAAVKQALALEQQAMNWAEPAGKVVWEEDPDEAAKLMAGAGYRWICDDSNGSSGLRSLTLPKGAMLMPPPVYGQAIRIQDWAGPSFDWDSTAIAFLHGLRSPAGNERLVFVYVSGGLSLEEPSSGLFSNSNPPSTSEGWTLPLQKTQYIVAVPGVPGRGENPAKPPLRAVHPARRSLGHESDQGGLAAWVFTPGAGGAAGQIKLEQRNRLRVFAGQGDPADASRFTIVYDVDGTPGVLIGRLKDDDTIELRPSTGKAVGDRWYPSGK
jgi:hypothetical protein